MNKIDPHTDPHHGLHHVGIKIEAARQALETANSRALSVGNIEAAQTTRQIVEELRGTLDGPWSDLEWITPKDVLVSAETAVFLAEYPAGWQIMVKALESELLTRADLRTR